MNSCFLIILIVGAVTTDPLLDELVREIEDYVDKRDDSSAVVLPSTTPGTKTQHPTSSHVTGSTATGNPSSANTVVTSTKNPTTSHTAKTASSIPSGSPGRTAANNPTSVHPRSSVTSPQTSNTVRITTKNSGTVVPRGTTTSVHSRNNPTAVTRNPSTGNPTGTTTKHRPTLYPPQTYPTEKKIKYYNSTGSHSTSNSPEKHTTNGLRKSSPFVTTPRPSPTQPSPVYPSRLPWVYSPQFACPVFERILFQCFHGFPKLSDISENTQTSPREFEPIFKKALMIFENIRKPTLVIDNLVEEVAQKMLERRMRCPTTKYQQALTYALRQEAKRTITSSTKSLSVQIHSVIIGFKDSKSLANKLATKVAEKIFESLVQSLLKEEFTELDYVIRQLRSAARKGFMKLEAHPHMDKDQWVRTALSYWYKEHSTQIMSALRCPTLQQLKDRQRNILQVFLSGFYEKEQSGAIIHLTRDMISQILREHGGDTAHTDYVFFPLDKVTAAILHFSRDVMNRTRRYEKSLYNEHLSMAAKKLFHLLGRTINGANYKEELERIRQVTVKKRDKESRPEAFCSCRMIHTSHIAMTAATECSLGILPHLLAPKTREPGQKNVLYEILRHLESSVPKTTIPGPTKSVVPTGLYEHVKEDIRMLKKLKSVLENEGKLNPHIKELITKRIREKMEWLASLKTDHAHV